jgi:hypothetical protein
MDDFLHNLRSGKLKQHDRSRSYSDPQYKGGQRRNTHQDRRKKELEAFERLNAVKEVLEAISGTQERMAEAYEARTMAEVRKAKALEVLAKNIYRMLNPDAKAEDVEALFAPDPATELAAETLIAPDSEIQAITQGPEDVDIESDTGPKKLTDSQRHIIFEVIEQMRDEGDNWEKIARHIASQGYPTVSGKGSWRGAMVKNIHEKMSSS